MAVSYVGAGAAASGNNTNLAPGFPADLQDGDLMVAILTARGNGTWSDPAGWNILFERQMHTNNLHKIQVAWRIFQTGDTAPTWNYTGGATGHTTIGQIAAWRGTHATTPFADQGADSSNASQQNIGPITGGITVESNRAVIVFGHKADDWTSVADLTGDGLTWVEIGEPDSTAGNDAGLVWDYALVPSTTAITDKTFTVTGGVANTGVGKMLEIAVEPAATQISVSDSGAGTDGTPAIEARMTVTDSSVGTDGTPAITASMTISDSGGGTEVLDLLISFTVSDSAAGSEVIDVSIQVEINVSDSAIGTDDVSISISISVTDSATGDDATFTITASVPIDDTASGTEAFTIEAAVPVVDTATGTDAPTIEAQLNLVDSAAGTEDVFVAIGVSVTDSATGSDALLVSVEVPVSDSASGGEVVDITATIPLADSAAGVDSIIIEASVPVSDTAAGAEFILVDTGGGVFNVAIVDSATGEEIITIDININISDSAAGQEFTLREALPDTPLPKIIVRAVKDPYEIRTAEDRHYVP